MTIIVRLYKLRPADAQLTLSRFYPMVLHTAGCIRSGTVDESELNWNGGWDVSHIDLVDLYTKVRNLACNFTPRERNILTSGKKNRAIEHSSDVRPASFSIEHLLTA